ncbi:MAG: hypothetical protein LKJ44_06685, partial [Bifidobacteriaceae bacterium]|nr:hypothetical protein [Bifidobacteriaceae bacterium]
MEGNRVSCTVLNAQHAVNTVIFNGIQGFLGLRALLQVLDNLTRHAVEVLETLTSRFSICVGVWFRVYFFLAAHAAGWFPEGIGLVGVVWWFENSRALFV